MHNNNDPSKKKNTTLIKEILYMESMMKNMSITQPSGVVATFDSLNNKL